MKLYILLFLSILFFILASISCSENPARSVEVAPQPLPDNTPFVMGLVEATDDTVHHFSELIAGHVSNIEGYFNDNSTAEIPGLYNPTLWKQATKTFQWFHLNFTPDDQAIVQVTGPVGSPSEKNVQYKSLGGGLFGDVQQELELIARGEYRLHVEYSNGTTYGANTQIPAKPDIHIPDSLALQVDYDPYHDGSAKETSPDHAIYYIPVTYPEGSYVTVVQNNANTDRETLLMEPGEHFLFENHSPYLRSGSMYAVVAKHVGQQDSLRRMWIQDLYNKYEDEVWHAKENWTRFSFFSESIGGIFFPLVDMFASDDQFNEEIYNPYIEEFEAMNSTYLLQTSTIKKADESGVILEEENSDAIGFFAGYFSVYHNSKTYPFRTFDLDSVLSKNRVYNPRQE